MVAILMLLFASCSTENVEAPIDDTNAQFTTLTFGAVLNDLANKAMQKGHFDQVPTCADAEPAVAVIEFSYGGSDYSATVDILSDASGYFTAYSDDLKIPVPSNGSTMVTVTGFMVYDGDTSVFSDAFYSPIHGNLIWIAPKGDDAQFDGYVEEALPVVFEVFPGTKPYFDIEVLCFDRRLVNEYGYVFFDILPKTVYPLCLFVNYCNVDDRHWVADYSIDLYFGTNANGIKLYDHTNPMAMATTGVKEGEFYADPLCLVIPGPPANLGNDAPYLYLVIYPEDWANSYGDIDNTPVPVQLSWNMVNALLNDDGTTNEYLHLLVGECDDARDGDPTIPGGGNGGNECDPNDDAADCDGDTIPNGVDNCPNRANPGQEPDQDCDGILDADEAEGCVNNPSPDCGVNPDPCANLPAVCHIPQTNDDLEVRCNFVYFEFDTPNNFMVINGAQAGIVLENGLSEPFGKVSTSQTGGVVSLSIDGNLIDDLIIAYEVEVRPNMGGSSMSSTCWESSCDSDVIAFDVSDRNQAVVNLTFSDFDYTYPYYVRVKAISCGAAVPQ